MTLPLPSSTTACSCRPFPCMCVLFASAANMLPSLWQRALSSGPDSTKDGDQDSSAEKGTSKDGRGAGEKAGMGGAGQDNTPPAGRGRGAFSQFLRTHEVSMLHCNSDCCRWLSNILVRQRNINWRYVPLYSYYRSTWYRFIVFYVLVR